MTEPTPIPNKNQFVTQCAIACGEPLFAAFLKEKHPDEWSGVDEAAIVPGKRNHATLCLYAVLDIKSRTELRTDPAKIDAWRPIFSDYEFWKADV
ncbi:hypothetical protein [uncultured Planktomarina sp.]|uniref:hypothetical protein n=1 Tax=uncultured Planktomarina sp. TaxID=1538529 RepID=UPI00325FE14A